MKIRIETIPHEQQRIKGQVGDWAYSPNGDIEIRISDLGNDGMNKALIIHELVEAMLCHSRGISTEEVDKFDSAYDGDGEAGDDPKSPYRIEHFVATTVERILAHELMIDWGKYDSRINEICEKNCKGGDS